MDIKSLKTHVIAFREAYKQGILNVSMDGSAQVTDEVLQGLAKETDGVYTFELRGCGRYPYLVSLEIDGTRYFTVCDENDFKNSYGGDDLNELITTN